MRTRHGDGAQERIVRLSRRQRIVGKAIAEIAQGEAQPIGQSLGVAKHVGPIREERLHIRRPLQMTLGVLGEKTTRAGQRGVIPEASEDIDKAASRWLRMENAVGGDGLKTARIGEIEESESLTMALSREVALHLDEGSFLAEKRGERLDRRRIGGESHEALEPFRLFEAATQAP